MIALPPAVAGAEREHPVHAREVAVALHRERARELERDDPPAVGVGRDRGPQRPSPRRRRPEADARKQIVRLEHDRRERDRASAQGVGNRELRGVGGKRSAAQDRRWARLDAFDQLAAGERREAVLPAVELRDRAGGHAEQRQLVGSSCARRPAENGRHLRAERLVARKRSRLERRDEPRRRQILAHGEVLRHRVGGLLGKAVVQRRAVDDGEEPEAEARYEEGDGHGRPARAPREGKRREPHVDPPATGSALEQAKAGHEQARGRDRDDEGDEAREEQEERARAAVLAQGAGVRVSAREGEDAPRAALRARRRRAE